MTEPSDSFAISWEEPPPVQPRRGHAGPRRGKWAIIADELSGHQGQWAKIGPYTRKTLVTIPTYIRRSFEKYRPDLAYEVTRRTDPDGGDHGFVYVRCLGPSGQDLTEPPAEFF